MSFGLILPIVVAMWLVYVTYKIIIDFHDSAYSKRITLQGYNYYKADGFFLKSIKKSEYIEGKRKEREERKECNRIKKELRNS